MDEDQLFMRFMFLSFDKIDIFYESQYRTNYGHSLKSPRQSVDLTLSQTGESHRQGWEAQRLPSSSLDRWAFGSPENTWCPFPKLTVVILTMFLSDNQAVCTLLRTLGIYRLITPLRGRRR